MGAIALALLFGISTATSAQVADPRIDRLEELVRTLTGQVEELTYRVQQLEQTVQRMQDDTDFRFEQLGAAAPAGNDAVAAAPPPASGQPLGAPPANLGVIPGAPSAAASAGGPLDLGQVLRNDGQFNLTPPAAVPSAAGAAIAQTPIAPITGNPQADYDRAYQLILNGDDVAAEQAFRAFLAAYPGNVLTVDAQYWLAESLFSRAVAPGAPTTLYVDAANAFLTAYRSAPQGDKAPDALLKLGISLVALGQVQDGCATYAQVLSTYPNISNALRQRVASEQQIARC